MCGLAGFTSLRRDVQVSKMAYPIFYNLFLTSQLRGPDASGLAGLWRATKEKRFSKKSIIKHWMIEKGMVPPSLVIKNLDKEVQQKYSEKKFKNLKHPELYTAIGHSRAATNGSVILENSHPFSFANNRFIGVHNGTIIKERYIKRFDDLIPIEGTFDYKERFEKRDDYTDSELILYYIYRYGIEKIYPHLRGAWAFVWYNQKDNSIYFIRNYDRPLYYYFDNITDCLYWSSEQLMLEFAFKRASFARWKSDKCCIFKANTLYKLSLDENIILTDTVSEFPWSEETELESGGFEHFYGHRSHFVYNDYKPKKSDTKKYNSGNITNLVWSQSLGRLVEEKDLPEIDRQEEHIINGYCEDSVCLWCQSRLDEFNMNKALKIKDIGTVCGVCSTNKEDIELIVECYDQVHESQEWIDRYIEIADEEE